MKMFFLLNGDTGAMVGSSCDKQVVVDQADKMKRSDATPYLVVQLVATSSVTRSWHYPEN